MPHIELHFTEYFNGETVVVSSRDRVVLTAEGLRTDMRTSLARIARIEVPDGPAELAFEVRPGGTPAKLAIDPSDLKFVVAALEKGRLTLKPITAADYEREPRGYA